ncbi:MAG: hypothetical protein ABSH44_08140 [Bryobacteraceae bacterium]|jgi:hypothetical protein
MTHLLTNRNMTMFQAARVALFLALVTMAPGLLSAQQPCYPHQLQGSYAFYGTGSAAGLGQITMVGIETFDGAGNTTLTETASFGGMIVRTGFSGTYKVNPDCSGTVVGTFPDGSTGHLDFVIAVRANNGMEIHAMESDTGVNLLITLIKQ